MAAQRDPVQRGWAWRFSWLVLFWLAGVVTMGAAAMLLRTLMRFAGMVS
jgi:hypothetical protein